MRIAVGGFHIESNGFSGLSATKDDFQTLEGDDLAALYDRPVIPLVYMRALPGGVVERSVWDAWEERFLHLLGETLDSAPLDAILLDMHGAAMVEGLSDPEAKIAEKVKGMIGEGCPLGVVLDPHGNVSDELFYAADYLTCYRTSPHTDVKETRLRAISSLTRMARSKEAYARAKVDIPLLFTGEESATTAPPAKGIYESLALRQERMNLVDASLWMGFPWADERRCHAAVVTVALDAKAAEQEALAIAHDVWDARRRFDFAAPADTASAAVEDALASHDAPFFISDTGDNPGAGAPGDSVALLTPLYKEWRETSSPKSVTFASLWVPDESWDTPGGPFRILQRFHDPKGGDSAVLADGAFKVIVTKERTQFSTKEQFLRAGIDPEKEDIVAVKMGYLEPELDAIAKDWLMALTPGASDQTLQRTGRERRLSPLAPFDGFDFDWRPKVLIR